MKIFLDSFFSYKAWLSSINLCQHLERTNNIMLGLIRASVSENMNFTRKIHFFLIVRILLDICTWLASNSELLLNSISKEKASALRVRSSFALIRSPG